MWTGASRGRMAGFEQRAKRYPTDLTDEEWRFIQPFLPPVPRRGRKAKTDLREVLDALR
jgi:putative transposase